MCEITLAENHWFRCRNGYRCSCGGGVEASEKVKYVKNYETQNIYVYIVRVSMAGDEELKEIQPKSGRETKQTASF